MVFKNNAINLDVTNSADGFIIAGGTTQRALTLTGGLTTLTASATPTITMGTLVFTLPTASQTLSSLAGVETLTNKTLTGNTNTFSIASNKFELFDNSDTTKKIVLGLSGITTSTTRTITVPDADFTMVGLTTTQTLTNKTLTSAVLNTGVSGTALETDLSVSASASKLPTAAAAKAYADSLLDANDAMQFKGVIDCSANPNYPAASAGHTYKVSVAGKIGGGSGINVEVGDTLYCTVDSTSSGTQAGVGANWVIVQTNIDGAVVGPTSSTDNAITRFDSTTGKLVQNSLATVDDNGAINIPSGQLYKINGTGLAFTDLTGDIGPTDFGETDPNADRLLFWDDSATAYRHLTLGTNLSITGTTINAAAGSSFTWTEVTGTSQSAAVDNGYITNNASLVTVTLPATATVGQVVELVGKGAGGWKLAQNASQVINFGNQATTSGTGGFLQSTNTYDAVAVICTTTNTGWTVKSSIGNISGT